MRTEGREERERRREETDEWGRRRRERQRQEEGEKKKNEKKQHFINNIFLNNNKNWIKDFNNNTAVDYCYLLAPFEEKKLWEKDSYDEGEKYHRTIW